jgi:MerR family transcriptional regulator, heat shock protein HspR
MTRAARVYCLQEVLQVAGISVRTLQIYEEFGFVSPTREGGELFYPEEALETIRRVQRLRRDLGVNLAGIEVILDMRRKIEDLQGNLEEIVRFLQDELRAELERTRGRTTAIAPKTPAKPPRTTL